MTLPGGAAAKLGYRYEKWWTIHELVRMLRGETDSLRIEPPGLHGVEFVVKAGGNEEYHQAKRSHRSGTWSVATLASSGVLANIGKLLIGNRSRFVFVSSSDARELADLCESAASAESLEEFEARFLEAKQRARCHERLLKEWHCNGWVAWDVLHRIDVRTISEHDLETKVRWGILSLFLGSDDHLCNRLAKIVDGAVHRTIKRSDLLRQLKEEEFLLRKVSGPHAARQAVVDATDRYLRGVRRHLIQGQLIPRTKTAEVIDRLTGEQPADCVLTGRAGTGKTGCVVEIVEKLRAKGVLVLALRLDRHMAATSTINLGQRLELEESPALVLNAAAQSGHAPAVLVIDQLDAVSAMSGRGSEAFDVVEQLLTEAKAASIRTLVVCRAFDWHNDPRLRYLIREDDREFNLEELTLDEVRSVLKNAGLNVDAFSTRQRNILCLPQNLSLLLNTGPSRSGGFSSVNDLFGRYWDEKRKLVDERAEGVGDQWTDMIDAMCDAMNATQQLSVRKEKLDQFSPNYLNQYVSENVFVADGDSYAFGHESFFDYCFARRFAIKEDSLVTVLKSDEQHLFRRAQVRQVLAYLREADFGRYIRELQDLVREGGVRAHIKGLIFAQLADVEDPQDAEWEVWMDSVQPQLDALENGTTNHDRLSELAWRELFGSKSWFRKFDSRGVIAGWLKKGGRRADLATEYLSWQQRDWPDRVAAFTEPYVDQHGQWTLRFQKIFSVFRLGASRRLFDLFLLLLDRGAFDATGDGQPVAGTWRVLETLEEWPAEWVPEVIAHLLCRYRDQVLDGAGADDPIRALRLRMVEDDTTKALSEVAKGHPQEFVFHVLPAVLKLAKAARKLGSSPPVRDIVWSFLTKDAYSLTDCCLEALTDALSRLAQAGADLRGQIDMLAREETYVANHLLLAIYRGGANRYADEAALGFCDHSWRFHCGYSDSSYWCATETLRAVVPHCQAENRARLEDVILTYVSRYEKTKNGVRHRGWVAFNLLAAIPEELRSDPAKRRFQEWQRKFHNPATAPRKVTAVILGPPIAPEGLDRMNDDDWLRAIAAYPSERSTNRDRLHGGAIQLAQAFGEAAQREPDRFAQIGLQLPPDTNPVYLSALLRGLAETEISEDTKLAVCRKAFDYARVGCGGEIADLLAKSEASLPDDALDMLAWLASRPEDLEDEEQWRNDAGDGRSYWGGDIYANGINTTRGRSALAIGELIRKDDGYISRLQSTLDKLVRVPAAAVGSCVAYLLRTVAYHDVVRSTDLFLRMNFSEERLLGTRHVYEFMHENLHLDLARMEGLIGRMVRSPYPDVSRAGARLGCIAGLTYRNALELAHECQQGNAHQRLGSADVAAVNVSEPECQRWCEGALKIFFDDPDPKVREVAASCFRHIPEDNLVGYKGLIEAFCNSSAFENGASFLLYALKKARAPLPAMTCLVCEKLLDRAKGGGRDTRRASEIVFRLYQQRLNDEWTERSLDLIDRLCLEAPADAVHGLRDFDR